MLTRLYAHNFRTLVNFELKLDRLNLLVGLNGPGKSSAFDDLRKLQSFLSGDSRTTEVFPSREKTRWVESPMQKFEMDLLIGPESFHYQLTIAHMTDGRRNRVEEEILTVDGNPLFLGGNGKGRLFRDDLSQGPEVSMDWERSGVGVLPSRSDNQKLTAFRQELEHFVIVAVSPTLMEGVSQQEAEFLSPRMENFVSWYRRIAQENIGAMPRLFQDLQRVIPGFSSFSLKSAGEDSKEMKVLFDRPSGRSPSLPLDFRELSDGQRVLIALYSLVYGTGGQRLSLFLDEPDNYVALRG